jgi:ankyrin repeat protein
MHGGALGKEGRTTVKVAKDAAAAAKELAKKVKEAESKLRATAGTIVPPANLDQALYEAARSCKRPQTSFFLKIGAKPDGFVEPDGWGALHYSRGDDPEIVRMYAEAGADLDRPTEHGLGLLDLICNNNTLSYPKLASGELLLARGARGHVYGGGTPLHYAAKHGQAELVVALLRAGFDPKAPGGAGPFEGKTPSDLAREAGAFATSAALERGIGG